MVLQKLKIEELVKNDEKHRCAGIKGVCVKMVAVGNLPSRFGDFKVVAFYNNKDKKEHAAIIHGDVTGKKDVPLRIHSECLTGDALGSLRCDCRDQLETSLKAIGKEKYGVVLYLRQEGRGIGFINKIKAYQLQDEGMDTVEANIALGFKDDEREYAVATHMIKSLKIKSVKLMTNNPNKIKGLEELGIKISGRIPIIIPPNKYNKHYLQTKKKKSGHMLESDK